MDNEDYCKKLWEEKQMVEEARRSVNDAMDDGFVSGIKWGLIIFVPLFGLFIWYMETM